MSCLFWWGQELSGRKIKLWGQTKNYSKKKKTRIVNLLRVYSENSKEVKSTTQNIGTVAL